MITPSAAAFPATSFPATSSLSSTPSTGPLAGLKVIELGQLIAGPFAAKTLAVPGIVPKLSATPGSHRRNAPTLGQGTDAVLHELGLTPAQIQGLKDKGIVSGGSGGSGANEN